MTVQPCGPLTMPHTRALFSAIAFLALFTTHPFAQDLPAQDLPAQDLPAQSLPAQSLPAQSLPAQSLPAQDRIEFTNELYPGCDAKGWIVTQVVDDLTGEPVAGAEV